MRLVRPLVPVLVLALVPFAASAQGDDAYCAALSERAYRYLATCATNGESKPDLETRTAIDACDRGNAAAGIAALEHKLRSNGFSLPRRP